MYKTYIIDIYIDRHYIPISMYRQIDNTYTYIIYIYIYIYIYMQCLPTRRPALGKGRGEQQQRCCKRLLRCRSSRRRNSISGERAMKTAGLMVCHWCCCSSWIGCVSSNHCLCLCSPHSMPLSAGIGIAVRDILYTGMRGRSGRAGAP